ncbi:MAG TPA: GGDEF domain-containing protein [Xanthobacteraceae bacterium]|nr:GGDEF domain-containing protein [Xanthobacteraceae bacterium]
MGKTIPLHPTNDRAPRASSRPSARRRPDEGAATGEAAPTLVEVRADPVRLAAEVARLEAELAAMRARIAELEARAESDPLTGIFNRRGFERELRRAAAHVRRYGGNAALIYLDLDGFKPVNDRHGHAAGDAVLKAVAGALAGSVRASDTVARLGGDEFAVLLWNLTAEAARSKADAIEHTIAGTTVPWGGQPLAVGATAGFAVLTADSDVMELVARADAAMYARKRKGRANSE